MRTRWHSTNIILGPNVTQKILIFHQVVFEGIAQQLRRALVTGQIYGLYKQWNKDI
jgi:hypothetical protein